MLSYNLSAPRRITASNLPLPSPYHGDEHAEPGVEVKIDNLKVESLLDDRLMRSMVATSKEVPTTNDGHGVLPLDEAPGMGIVIPGGLNMYYIDMAPKTEGVMHRTTSTDYLVVLSGQLSLMTPSNQPYHVDSGKATYSEPVETVCHPGDVIAQRGIMHALSNRTNEWVRVLAIVLSSKSNRVPIEGTNGHKDLADAWLA
ncbi:hypothetical protein C7999DRAFT_42920 [Corynascus novoguineensis]|uniref:Uncharacterized protein n=1 Tax=Corynascus novoguineensis TaxID=1126955 RepID=A0AAN7CNY4_9PEZI|nr:hypothetical protein C7999DRAFT_42920 [Corynascus novoguineensis]